MDWDDEYNLQATGGGTAGPSFIDRVRNAPPDEDEEQDTIPGLAVTNETPLEQLIRHWTNERHAPDLLAAQEDLLANLLDHLRRQVGTYHRLERKQFMSDTSQKLSSFYVEMHLLPKKSISGSCSHRWRSSGSSLS